MHLSRDGCVFFNGHPIPRGEVIAIVRRSTNAAIVALAISMLEETDLHGNVDPQHERQLLR